jgi:glycerol kinase
MFGTVDAWLAFKLTGRPATDPSNASRTMLFDIAQARWDPELLELFGVPEQALPRVFTSSGELGTTRPEALHGHAVPVAGMAGDQQAALFGQAWGIGQRLSYALEAAIFITGAAVQWLRDGLGLIETAAETEQLAASLESNDGVYFVPALTGLGSPHWDPYARGTIVGLTRGSTKAHLARAALEAIAYQTVDAIGAIEQASGERLSELRADGGATANAWLMQFQADVLGVPVIVPEIAETTALGAAYLAGIGTGLWTIDQVASSWRERARYEPTMGDDERQTLVAQWRRALARAREWAEA